MALFRTKHPQDQEQGRSLLQGLMILAAVGIIITVVVSQFL